MAPIVRIGRTILVILSLLLVIGCLNPITDPPLSYLLRFDANGAVGELDPPYPVAPAFVSVQTGDGVVIPGQGTLVNGGMLFAGWNTRVGGGGDHYLPGSVMVMPGRDVTLYAQWDATGLSHTVSFESNGGSAVAPQIVPDGDLVPLPADPIRSGYLFAGWFADDGTFANPWVFATDTVGADITLYAQWAALPTYGITYDANGGIGAVPTDAGSYYDGQAITIAGQGALTNGTELFAGWNTAGDGSGAAYAPGPNIMPAGALALYAQWSAVPTYNITYDANGGINPPTDGTPYLDGDPVNVLGPGAMTRAGYQFANWNTADNGSGATYNAGDIYTIAAANVTLYAQWTQLYTVTFVSNGGSAVAPETIPGGGLVTDPGAPVLSGHTFNGWFTDAGTFMNQWMFASHTVTSDTILYAAWTQIDYQIMFDANGGTGTMASQFVVYGGSVTLTSNTDIITRVDHRFMGWSDTAVGFVDWNDGALYSHAIEGNRTLYAVWEPTYTVTYTALNATTGTPPTDPNEYVAGDLVEVLGNLGTLARSGHTFSGWTDGFNNYVASNDFSMPAAHVVLDPIWIPDATYTVIYDGGGHTGGAPPLDGNSYLAGVAVTPEVLGDLVRLQDGISLRFTGWNQIGGGGGIRQPGVGFTMPAENITLQAMWDMDVIGATGPGGGMVFHDKGFMSDGWRYLEAAPVDQSAGISWGPNDDSTGATHGNYGDGALNTALITSTFGAGTYAALAADQYLQGGFTDWYLPSQAETYRMYQMLHLQSLGGFTANFYWSSGEAVNAARRVNFLDGTINTAARTTNHRVRAIRSFGTAQPSYVIAYVKNGADFGAAPVDPYHYEPGQFVTPLDGVGTMVLTGHTFIGWNTAADGSGAEYLPGATPPMPSANLVLYAQWSLDPEFAGGNGTAGDPYQVATATQLNNVRNYLDAAFLQTADINLGVPPWNEDAGWVPIGFGGPKFSGIYDGNSHTINGMYINRVGIGQGLFGYTEGASISNLRLTNVSMNVGNNNAGAIAGANQTAGSTFHRVSATGTIISNGYNVGGLIGFATNLTMSQSYAQINVTASYNVGGLVGNLSSGTIEDSYATGNVAGTHATEGRIGGLVGNKSGIVSRSYAAGAVSTVGGPTGGLVGFGGGTVTAGYYDMTVSGQSDDVGQGSPLTSAQMLEAATFTTGSWDFGSIWTNQEGISYPHLFWQNGTDIPYP